MNIIREETRQEEFKALGAYGRKVLASIRKYNLELVEQRSHFGYSMCDFVRLNSGIKGGRTRNRRTYAVNDRQFIALMTLGAIKRTARTRFIPRDEQG